MIEYIEREAVLQKIRGYRGFFQDNPSSDHMVLKMEVENIVKDQESADVAPVVHGKWVKKPVYRQDLHGKMIHFCTKYICSACNHESNTLSSGRFCPNCGAKMDLKG